MSASILHERDRRALSSVAGGGASVLCLGLLLAFLLAGRDRIIFAWQGPHPAFAAADIDTDGELSREEWERESGTNALDDAVLDFDRADCNRNGRLTWEEYFALRFREGRCQTGPLETRLRQAGRNLASGVDQTWVFSEKDLHLARVSLVRNRQRLIEGKYHGDYSEQDMEPGTLHLYTLSCGDLGEVEVPAMSQDFRQVSRLGLLEPGPYPAIRCTLSNRSNRTVSYLRLRITLSGEAGAEAFHGKPLWVPAKASRDFWILPASGKSPVGVDLLAVRTRAD